MPDSRSATKEGLVTMTFRSHTLGVAALACAVVSSLLGTKNAPQVQAATVPTGLPSHFGIGLMASPDNNGIYGWMPNSGISWDYAYQYLSGGVNTGSGW